MRLNIDTYNEIVETLSHNKSRSLLTGFGVFWGLFMLLFLVGGGHGFKEMIMENFAGFANNAGIIISQNTSLPYAGFQEGRYWSLTTRDLDRIRTLVPECDAVVPMLSVWGDNARSEYQDRTCNSAIKSVTADYSKIEPTKLKYGRYLTENDVKQERKVCVLGKRVYETLFPEGGNPCGEFIKVGGIYYEVVGVDFATANININGSASESVIIPFTIAQKIFNRGNSVDIICITAKGGIKMSSIEPKIRQALAREHLFDWKDEQALMVLKVEEMFSLVDNLFRGLNFLIWLIGLGTLLAGIIGVSNIMMVTVKGRTTEIGLRRAIGATKNDVLSQIILESITLTLIAGMGGIMFSVLVLKVFEKAAGGAFMISFGTAVLAALLLSVLGVVAGLAPAFRAVSIKPVDAMRDE